MSKLLTALLEKGSQESTWRGLIQLLTAFGVALKPELAAAIVATGMSLIGLINVIKKD